MNFKKTTSLIFRHWKELLIPLFIAVSFFPFRHIMNLQYASRFGWYLEPLAISIYTADFIFIAVVLFFWKKLFEEFKKNWMLLSVIIIFMLAQSMRNSDPALGWYVFIRFLQFTILLLLFSVILRSKTIIKLLCVSLLAVGVLQSTLVIYQVTNSHSLGLKWLGEQTIDISKAGVAKVDLANGKLLRGYGTLPHPNILAGLLTITIASNLWLIRTKTSKMITGTLYCLGLLQIIGMTLTFSRAGFLSLAILLFLFFASMSRIKRGTLSLKKWGTFVLLTLSLLVLINSSTGGAIYQRLLPPKTDVSLSERIFLLRENWKIFRPNLILGVGNGQYIINYILRVPSGTGIEKWQYDFPHNVVVQLCSELGILGFLIFALLVFTLIKYNTKNWRYFWFAVAIIFPYLMFDHFLWTNQSGRILLILSITLLPIILAGGSVEFGNEKSN
jgi:hypothetical protein